MLQQMLNAQVIHAITGLIVGLFVGAAVTWLSQQFKESEPKQTGQTCGAGWLVQFQTAHGSWLSCMVTGGLYQVAYAIFDDAKEAERYRIERQKAGRANGLQIRYRVVRASLVREF